MASEQMEQAKKIRVCLAIPRLAIGGAEVEVLNLIKHLDKSRFDVSLLCVSPGLAWMEQEARGHLETLEIAGFRWRYFPVSFAKMVAWLRRGRFDVIHCHMPIADVVCRIAGWLARIPVIVTTEHGKFLGKPWYHLLLERALNPITDMRICVSQDILEIRHRREGTPLAKLVRIPNAVETERFRAPTRDRASVMAEFGWNPDDQLVISVGRLEPEKNYPALVEAIGKIGQTFPGVRCLIAGDGTRRRDLVTQVESLHLGDRVVLPGSRKDIPDLVGAADVFVLPSLKEGLPLALLEAMASGRAVVVTSVGGMAEVIRDGENGLVVPPGSPNRLAEAISRLLAERDLRTRFGGAAAKQAEAEFGMTKVADQIAGLYTVLYAKKTKQAARN